MTKHRYVIVACARWETPAIREWLTYHRAIGFDHIYLYCNDDDPSALHAEVFADPASDNFVTFRHFSGQGQQAAMYRDALAGLRDAAEWVTFLDIDEFLVLRGINDIARFMAPFEQGAHSVCFNWLMFGNNGFLQRPAGSVLHHYITRAATLDVHTKHLCRVAALTEERLAAAVFPFWHGLTDPVWADLRRVNVLGQGWNHYLDQFPARAAEVLSDPATVGKIISTAVVHHYVFKSEADFLRRAQRGLGGQFGGQVHWAQLYQSGGYRQVLADLGCVEDTYLRDFAQTHAMAPCPLVELCPVD